MSGPIVPETVDFHVRVDFAALSTTTAAGRGLDDGQTDPDAVRDPKADGPRLHGLPGQRDGHVAGPLEPVDVRVQPQSVRVPVRPAGVRHGVDSLLDAPPQRPQPADFEHPDGQLAVGPVETAEFGRPSVVAAVVVVFGRGQRGSHLGLEPGHHALARRVVHFFGDRPFQRVPVHTGHQRPVNRVGVPVVRGDHVGGDRSQSGGPDDRPAAPVVETGGNVGADRVRSDGKPTVFGMRQIRFVRAVGAEILKRTLDVNGVLCRVDRQVFQTSGFQVPQLGVVEHDVIVFGNFHGRLFNDQRVFHVQKTAAAAAAASTILFGYDLVQGYDFTQNVLETVSGRISAAAVSGSVGIFALGRFRNATGSVIIIIVVLQCFCAVQY